MLFGLFGSFLNILGSLVGNQRVLGAWLVLLTAALAQTGQKVYINRPAELAEIRQSSAVTKAQIEGVMELLGQAVRNQGVQKEQLEEISERLAAIEGKLGIYERRPKRSTN